MSQDEPQLLTVKEASERLAAAGVEVSAATVQRWCRTGGIAATKFPGGRYHIRAEVVDALIGQPLPNSEAGVS